VLFDGDIGATTPAPARCLRTACRAAGATRGCSGWWWRWGGRLRRWRLRGRRLHSIIVSAAASNRQTESNN
jgi:hypothetical protein